MKTLTLYQLGEYLALAKLRAPTGDDTLLSMEMPLSGDSFVEFYKEMDLLSQNTDLEEDLEDYWVYPELFRPKVQKYY